MTKRRLDQELVRRGLAASRNAAQQALADGRVRVTGMPQPKASSMVDDAVGLAMEDPPPFVSRGGLKLQEALERFEVSVEGLRAIDVGASTGGFTDCLLQRGAASVTAVDVGYGQIDWKLRSDERVIVIERTNFRHADPGELGAPFDVVVADLSFISLRTVAAALNAVGSDETHYFLLVKPQFEVGREMVGPGGIVASPALHLQALRDVTTGLADAGLGTIGVCPSPITGTKGNREFLIHVRKGSSLVAQSGLESVVDA
ncbi:MAG: TlyA family RNA methyltransferase [Acidimicrobiia bacterium]|nr:TlyA family RNA methyltransferase [Acidimicrobiia bacterium]